MQVESARSPRGERSVVKAKSEHRLGRAVDNLGFKKGKRGSGSIVAATLVVAPVLMAVLARVTGTAGRAGGLIGGAGLIMQTSKNATIVRSGQVMIVAGAAITIWNAISMPAAAPAPSTTP